MRSTILLLFIILSSCQKTYVCTCHTNNEGQNYDMGHLTSTGKADIKCVAYKSQYNWDTCVVGIYK